MTLAGGDKRWPASLALWYEPMGYRWVVSCRLADFWSAYGVPQGSRRALESGGPLRAGYGRRAAGGFVAMGMTIWLGFPGP